MLSKYQLSRIETLGIIRPMLCLLSSLKNEVKPRKKKKKRKEKKVCAISELFLCLPFKMYSLLATLRQKRQLKSKSLLILFRKFLWRQRTIPSKEDLPRFHDQARITLPWKQRFMKITSRMSYCGSRSSFFSPKEWKKMKISNRFSILIKNG